jgi:sec-independent protein translocase protein TatC
MPKFRDKEMGIWEHMSELITRARIALIAFILCTVAVMAIPINLWEVLSNPFAFRTLTSLIITKIESDLLPPGTVLIAGNVQGPIMAYIYASAILGFLMSSPIIAYEAYAFVNPGLRSGERKLLLSFFLPFLMLFAFGCVYAYKFIIPISLRFMLLFNPLVGSQPFIKVDDLLSLIFSMFVICGLFFNVPLIFVFLVKAGIIDTRSVTERRKYIYGGLIILLTIVTADPTIVSDILLFLPFIILMEGAILVAKKYERERGL